MGSKRKSWKFSYDLPSGSRELHLGIWVTVLDGDVSWYSRAKCAWVKCAEVGSSTCFGCKCLRSFKRHLRKHPELKGSVVCLASRYDGCDITARWC